MCRLATPAAALLCFAALAALWRWGPRTLYFAALKLFGFQPFRFPFLDIHAVLSAAQCRRLGIDVYLTNPCDALGRVHAYSPLWLVITPRFLDTTSTIPVGLVLDLMFIFSLPIVLRPNSWAEMLIFALVVLSPMTVYALERANCDLVIFLLIVGGCALGQARWPWRLGAFALYLFAGLLKYYPLALLALLARERRRDALIGAAIAISIVLGLAGIDYAELAKALRNIPVLSYFSDSFSARNLPFGLATILFSPRLRGVAGLLLLAFLAVIAAARTLRTVRLLDHTAPDPDRFEGQCLLVGATLTLACFWAGQNVAYRGIFFVLVMPGLLGLRRLSNDELVRRFLTRMIAAVLFVVWEEPLRDLIPRIANAVPGMWRIGPRLELSFWVGRELAWWWLISGLAALVLSYAIRLPIWPSRLPRVWFYRSLAASEITPAAKPR
jgi:hypothetical protein